MRKIFIPLFILFFSVFGSVARAQEQTPSEISKKFFELYSTKPTDAIDYIFSGVKKEKQIGDDITAIKKNLKATIDLDGIYYGNDLLTEKNLGANMKLMSYILRYEKQPIRFIFIYYKPNDKWKIYTFQFNANLDDELTNAASMDLFKPGKE